jgi:sterol desaturase/sphingolipid hydroxylase (fatty acid hydroxylase superfamily)
MKPSPFFVRTSSYLAVFIILLFFEWLSPFARSEQKKSYRVIFHFGLSVMNSLILFLTLAGPTYALALYAQGHKWGLNHLLGLNGELEILATVIAFDFWDYGMHLANHKIRFLWRFHKAHHSDMEVDVTTASRFHVGELLISGGTKCLMIVVWGPSLWGLVVFDTLLTAFSQFHHSNVNIPLRLQDGIEKLIVTPRMHRCHHALHPNCFNTNFSAIVNLWDRLFRTYHWGRDIKELELIGVFKPRGPSTMKFVPFLFTPIREIE